MVAHKLGSVRIVDTVLGFAETYSVAFRTAGLGCSEFGWVGLDSSGLGLAQLKRTSVYWAWLGWAGSV